MKSVALIDLGGSLPLSLGDLTERLNTIQGGFEFNVIDTVTLDAIGDPDVEEVWYSTSSLFKVLKERPSVAEFDFIVGITHLPVARTDDSGKTIDTDYFSLSDERQLSIISTHANVMVHRSSLKSELQYVAYLMTGELLINLAGKDLMHIRPDNCLFDDCVERERLAQCMDKSHICTKCREMLREKGISDQTIGDVESVLNWCKRPTLSLALMYAFSHPLTVFLVGITLGWLSSVFIGAEYYVIVLILSIGFPAMLFLRKWMLR